MLKDVLKFIAGALAFYGSLWLMLALGIAGFYSRVLHD
jgi:hypothetical protein